MLPLLYVVLSGNFVVIVEKGDFDVVVVGILVVVVVVDVVIVVVEVVVGI
jgi:hypothetical protein